MSSPLVDLERVERRGASSIRGELARLVAERTATQGHDLDASDVDRFLATARALLPAPRTLLDAGCGTGVLTDLARFLGYQSTGIDLDPLAMRHMGSPSVVGSIGDLPFADRSFEIAVANEVLEHLPVDVFAAARAELARVTSQQVVVTVPNRESLESASTQCPACFATYSIHGHVRRFDPLDMPGLLPGFSLTSLGEVGPFKIRHRSVEWVFRRRLLGAWPAQPGAICPQCGWQQEGTHSPSDSGSRLSRAVRLIGGIPWQRWWLVATYERRLGP